MHRRILTVSGLRRRRSTSLSLVGGRNSTIRDRRKRDTESILSFHIRAVICPIERGISASSLTNPRGRPVVDYSWFRPASLSCCGSQSTCSKIERRCPGGRAQESQALASTVEIYCAGPVGRGDEAEGCGFPAAYEEAVAERGLVGALRCRSVSLPCDSEQQQSNRIETLNCQGKKKLTFPIVRFLSRETVGGTGAHWTWVGSISQRVLSYAVPNVLLTKGYFLISCYCSCSCVMFDWYLIHQSTKYLLDWMLGFCLFGVLLPCPIL